MIEAFPGEFDPITHEHIPPKVWFRLGRSAAFKDAWRKQRGQQGRIAFTCLMNGLTDEQIITLVRIWSKKNGIAFDERSFRDNELLSAGYACGTKVYEFAANVHWKTIRYIQRTTKARLHSRLRIAYWLMNEGPNTIRAISAGLQLPLKTVRNNIPFLVKGGEVAARSDRTYAAWTSTFLESQLMEQDHPALYFGLPNEYARDSKMFAYDYTHDRMLTVTIRRPNEHDRETEWILNASGNVVQHGLKTVFPETPNDNKEEGEVDFFARLKAKTE